MKIYDNRTVTDILNKEYKDFSIYVLEHRAVSSLVDGFKPTQRKIIYTSLRHIKNASNKVATLAGKVISDAAYHHGNVSCEDGIVNLTQEFKNNLPLFEKIGQFGSLRSPKASASRYISVKLSSNFDKIYKDNELLEFKYEDSQKIEPYYYLPIIPMLLVNGSIGIAVGFSSIILTRCPKDVVKQCINYLTDKKVSKLKMKIDTFNGEFVADKEVKTKWYIKGVFKRNNNNIEITELPPSMTYEKFDDLLDNLEQKKYITKYENNNKNGILNYKIYFPNIKTITDEDIIKNFKLIDQVTENFTTLDEFNKLKIFDSAEDILKYFVDFRLTIYDKRKKYLIEKINNDINIFNNKAKFIKNIIDNKLVINKRKKDEIISDLIKQNFDKIEDSYDYLLNMPIYNLTKEKYDEILDKIKKLKVELGEVKKSDTKEWYINELNELQKKL